MPADISRDGNSWLCPRRISPDASLHPGPATSGHRREELASMGRELCGVGVGRGLAFGPGRALWETLISLTLTRAPHGITSKSQDKPSRQPECLLLGRDNGHLAPPDSHLWGSTQAAPSPPVLLRSLPTTGALSNFPHHPGASQDQRISSGPQQGTSPAGSGLGRGRIGRQERGSPAGKKGAKGKQVEPL